MALDQSQLASNGTAYIPDACAVWQSFTAGASGTLANVIVWPTGTLSGLFTFTVYTGQGTGGTILFSHVWAMITSGFPTRNGLPCSAAVTSGQTYTFSLAPVYPYNGIPTPYEMCVGCTTPNAFITDTIAGATWDPYSTTWGVPGSSPYAAGDGTVRDKDGNIQSYVPHQTLLVLDGQPNTYPENTGGTAIYAGGVMGVNNGSDYQNENFALKFQTILA